ncbi:hypothetical protein SIN09_33105, partial [Streptomyces sp. F8]|uniref:hypothetical protein n=1 Tax=Streptomyces sp. F8 TaxID=1436085 RepID=UPI0029D2B42F
AGGQPHGCPRIACPNNGQGGGGITFQRFVEIDMTGPGTCPSATITRMAHTLTNIDSVYGI